MIPLEDQFNDIIGKAMRGFKIDAAELARRASVDPQAVQRLCEGVWDEKIARAIAPKIGLHPDALAESGNRTWYPEPVSLEGLAQFNTPYEDMTVNSYLAWDPNGKTAIAFDTGADCTAMLDMISDKKLDLKFILITHTHGDHIFDLDRLKEKTGAIPLVCQREKLPGEHCFDPGDRIDVPPFIIDARFTWGHSLGGTTFVFGILALPVAIVGDAMFAGSMGGASIDYGAALASNRMQIMTLPPETVLCPGHGPMTTVAEQALHNPFFAHGVDEEVMNHPIK